MHTRHIPDEIQSVTDDYWLLVIQALDVSDTHSSDQKPR